MYYSTIINKIPCYITAQHLSPYVYIMDESTNKPMLAANDRPMTRKWEAVNPPVTEKIIAKWVTPKPLYNELEPHDRKLII